jgi:hypothetical protein
VLRISKWFGRATGDVRRSGGRSGFALVLVVVAAILVPLLEATPAPAQTVGGSTVTSVTETGSPATVGATVALTANFSSPAFLGAVNVQFTVISGPNTGFTFTCSAAELSLSSSCGATYSSTLAGTDTISAGVAGQSSPPTVTVTWLGIPAAIGLSPVLSFNHINDTVNVTATVVDQHGTPVPNASVAFTASGTGAETPPSGNGTTNGSGTTNFSFTSATSGKSTVVASVSPPSGPAITTSATAYFAGNPATVTLTQQNFNGLAPVGGTDTVSAYVVDSSQTPVGDGTNVAFTVAGAGAQTGVALTSGGHAVFNFSSDVTGTSTITATAGGITSSPVTATWETPVASQVTLTPKISAVVIGKAQTEIAEVTDQFGQDFNGALVRFAVLGANASATTSSQTTDATGKVGFQYIGANVGIDTVVAFVDLNDDDSLDPGDPYTTATIIWLRHPGQGYWMVASDGGIFNYGPAASFYGSAGSIHLNQPIVGMANTPDGGGYWLVASDGGIFSYGDAQFQGSTGSIHLNKPIVGMASTPDGGGYWLVASDGGIFAYGDARFFGSTGSIHLNKPIVGMASTPDGAGYWLVASDGGIFAYGDARFFGSTGSTILNKPIVGMAASPTGAGYWLVASDGGIFNYGDATFYGSAGSVHLNKPIIGMGAISDGSGYFMAASDGGIFNYGPGATSFGSAASSPINRPVVGIAVAP